MRTFILLTTLALISSCSHFKSSEHQEYKILVGDKSYAFNILKEKEQVYVATSLAQSLTYLPLFPAPEDGKLLQSPVEFNGSQWHHHAYPEVKFTKVFMAPYYSLYVYGLLSRLQSIEGGIFAPECPFETKFLTIIYHEEKSLPIIGCVI